MDDSRCAFLDSLQTSLKEFFIACIYFLYIVYIAIHSVRHIVSRNELLTTAHTVYIHIRQ